MNYVLMTPAEQYELLSDAKDLLAFLFDAYNDFPISAYFEGSAQLTKAMAFLDKRISDSEAEIF